MNKKEFLAQVQDRESRILAVDFDGVIHTNELGFHDGTIYGSLIEGAREALQQLSEKYTLVIYTVKANPSRPLVNGKTGKELIWEWLRENNLDSYIEDVTYDKVNAVFYIDDKAIRFVDWESTLKQIL